MKIIALTIKFSLVIVTFLSTFNTSVVYSNDDLGLCPNGYDQGTVTTGFVECDRETIRTNSEQVELLRLQREAVCEAHPNSQLTSSEVFGTSDGRFFAKLICTVTRSIPTGTVLCPDGSEEVYRAFDTLVCQNFGSASSTAQEAQSELDDQILACTSAEGQIIETQLAEEMFDDITFFTSSAACSFTTAAVDNIECPFNFSEVDRDENNIECQAEDSVHESFEEAEEASDEDKLICTDTTAGLGSVDPESLVGISSDDIFFNIVTCNISIPRYDEFEDSTVIRTCDATCTEEVEQSRICLNGGEIGGPGCIESSTQTIERRCNTGTNSEGLCPLVITPTIITPLLLEEEDDDDDE